MSKNLVSKAVKRNVAKKEVKAEGQAKGKAKAKAENTPKEKVERELAARLDVKHIFQATLPTGEKVFKRMAVVPIAVVINVHKKGKETKLCVAGWSSSMSAAKATMAIQKKRSKDMPEVWTGEKSFTYGAPVDSYIATDIKDLGKEEGKDIKSSPCGYLRPIDEVVHISRAKKANGEKEEAKPKGKKEKAEPAEEGSVARKFQNKAQAVRAAKALGVDPEKVSQDKSGLWVVAA